MIALVTTIVLPALFAVTGAFAVAVLGGTWRNYAGAYRRLNAELAGCETMRAVSVTIARTEARSPLGAVRLARRIPRGAVAVRSAMRPARSVAA